MLTDLKFALPITLMTPDRLVWPVAWVGHIPFAWWLVASLRIRHMVELGTHTGNSYCGFMQAAQKLGLLDCPNPSIFRAVDHWKGDEHAGLYDDSVFEELLSYTEAEFGDATKLMRMGFDDALLEIEDGSVDLLHIDGLHTYQAVRHDFESWLPKLSPTGVVLLHDTQVYERDFGVHRLFSELSEQYPAYEFTHSNGLGVLAVGPDVPPPIQMLTGSGVDADGIQAQAYFRLVGEANRIPHLESEIEILTEQRDRFLSDVHEIIADRDRIIADLDCMTADRDRIRADLDRITAIPDR